jgi:hypothetical protein
LGSRCICPPFPIIVSKLWTPFFPAYLNALVAFVGLDPRACDSGQKAGRRRLSKRGSGELRRLLYNCAQAAAKTKTWKPYYTQLKTGRFSTTQALVIIARKLLRIAFSIWQQPGGKFDPQKIACLTCPG